MFLEVRNISQRCIQTFVQSIMRFVLESKSLETSKNST